MADLHPAVAAGADALLQVARREDESCCDACSRDHEIGVVGADDVWGTPARLATVAAVAALRGAAALVRRYADGYALAVDLEAMAEAIERGAEVADG